MSRELQIWYSVSSGGKHGGSDDIEWDTVELDDEALEEYDLFYDWKSPLDNCPCLKKILDKAYKDIEDEEIGHFLEWEDQDTMECMGLIPVTADRINELVAKRDPHTLKFFGLTDLSDEELENWDAEDLEELPNVCDFEEGFEPESPFDCWLTLHVWLDDIHEYRQF